MLCLPALSFGGGDWRLPLAPASAEALIEVLLMDRAEDRSARLVLAVEGDPGLALWAFCRASLDGARNVDSAAALADWLAESAVDRLDGLQAGDLPNDAHRSALLHAADAWQMASGGRQPPAETADKETRSCQLQSPNGDKPHFASATIAAEHSYPRSDAPRSPLPDWLRSEIDDDSKQCDSEQCDGQAECSFAERMLPALICKMARLQRLETAFHEQLEIEKLEAMAEFAAGAGHEINNPIAVIAGRAQLFMREERDPERRRELAVMNVQAMRVYEMIADMMLFARPPAPKRADCDVSKLLDRLLGELAPEAARRQIDLCREGIREPLVIQADIDQIGAAVRALIENAIEALPDGGRVSVGLTGGDPANERVEIVVRDNGPGISPEIRRHLFDPFFSGRGAGRGIGLGLSKCWRIVTNHGGRIEVESDAGAGATFTICLPVMAGASPIRNAERRMWNEG
jgi:signal transduction histidine kinase